MLSVHHYRTLLGGKSCNLSDHQIEILVGELADFANIFVRALRPPAQAEGTGDTTKNHKVTLYQTALTFLAPDDRYLLEERAAILEFDGKLSRQQAQREALAWLLRRGKAVSN